MLIIKQVILKKAKDAEKKSGVPLKLKIKTKGFRRINKNKICLFL